MVAGNEAGALLDVAEREGDDESALKSSISAVGTSMKLDPSAFTYKRVKLPTISRRWCLILNPFLVTATQSTTHASCRGVGAELEFCIERC